MNPWLAKEEKFRKLVRKQELLVLVWGPGDPGSKASAVEKLGFNKRKQIKKEIEKVFSEADVRFSEDPVLRKMTSYLGRELMREMVHAKLADVVILLDISRGVDLEVDHFVETYEWFRNKAYVLIPQKYVKTKGLIADVFKNLRDGHLIGFTDYELKHCTVATKVCVGIVDEVALRIFALL